MQCINLLKAGLATETWNACRSSGLWFGCRPTSATNSWPYSIVVPNTILKIQIYFENLYFIFQITFISYFICKNIFKSIFFSCWKYFLKLHFQNTFTLSPHILIYSLHGVTHWAEYCKGLFIQVADNINHWPTNLNCHLGKQIGWADIWGITDRIRTKSNSVFHSRTSRAFLSNY